MNRFSSRRLSVFFRRLSPLDRIALAIIALYVAIRAVETTGFGIPFSAFIGFLAFLAVVYLVFRSVPWIRSELLWRLRNRLIVAYVFIAVVPVVLLLAMAGAGSYLAYLQLGAHLLRDHIDEQSARVKGDADAISDEIVAEVATGAPLNATLLSRPEVAALIRTANEQFAGVQVFFDRGRELVGRAGRPFSGLLELDGKLWFASAEARAAKGKPFVIMVAAPVTPTTLDRLGSELGPIQFILLKPTNSTHLTLSFNNKSYEPGQQIVSLDRRLAPPEHWWDIRVNGAATFEARRADSPTSSDDAPVYASFSLRPMMVNRHIFPSVGAFGPYLMTILAIIAVIFLALEIAALATGVVLSRTITTAIGDLYQATLHVRRGDFSYRVRVRRDDQLGELGKSFNEMTTSISDLLAEQKQRQRLEHEIEIAREVQEQLFPRSIPSVPGLQLAAICRPARTVSGDYYDFIRLGPDRVAIALADISGKGIFAALLMASVQAALRSMALNDGRYGTAGLVTQLNNHLYRNTSDDRYATFFYAVYDASSRMLTYTNAGHLTPFFVSDAGVQRLDEGGTVVGLFEDAPYSQGTLKVAPGSTLVAFSDGLTEPENVYGEEFGMDRVRDEILRQRNTPPERVAENLIAATEQWAGTPEQADDITVIVARMG
ncbi:MAG TPA: SpoIIE family protein phosphatase [Candidatus Acidoferrum sp.]|nr:SpoIIE family protein phosphatase [Candidatus Acidoferrum sp.]